MSVPRFCRLLIGSCINSNIVDAVLDQPMPEQAMNKKPFADPLPVKLRPQVLDLLEKAAARRHMSAAALAALMVEGTIRRGSIDRAIAAYHPDDPVFDDMAAMEAPTARV